MYNTFIQQNIIEMHIITMYNNVNKYLIFFTEDNYMKREIRGLIIGMIIMCLLMNSVSATGIKQVIEVVFNEINIEVDGVKVDSDNILYNETSYVPLRKVAEMLGKEVTWDGKTNTASIIDKQTRVEEVQQEVISEEHYGYNIYFKNEKEELYLLNFNDAVHIKKGNSTFFDIQCAYMLYQLKMDNLDYVIEENNQYVNGKMDHKNEKDFPYLIRETQQVGINKEIAQWFLLNEDGEKVMIYDDELNKDTINFMGKAMVNIDKYFEVMGTEFDLEIKEINIEDKYIIVKR